MKHDVLMQLIGTKSLNAYYLPKLFIYKLNTTYSTVGYHSCIQGHIFISPDKQGGLDDLFRFFAQIHSVIDWID